MRQLLSKAPLPSRMQTPTSSQSRAHSTASTSQSRAHSTDSTSQSRAHSTALAVKVKDGSAPALTLAQAEAALPTADTSLQSDVLDVVGVNIGCGYLPDLR